MGNFLEAKAIILKRKILLFSAHFLGPAWLGRSALFCETALYF